MRLRDEPGVARRDRHGGAPRRRRSSTRRRISPARRPRSRTRGCPTTGPGVFAPGTARVRRRRRLRRRRPDGDAADRVADARRGPEAPLRVAHARAGGGRGRAPRQPARHALVHRRRDRAASADAHRRRALRGGRRDEPACSAPTRSCARSRHEGVDVMFGIPGGAILPTYDAIARGTTVRHVLARHEQGAGHMAEGYARASGKVGVAIATSGPGATNLVTPIADAWMDSTPLVCDHRPGALEPDRHRRVPGDRRDRHHDADRQALVARPGRRGAAGSASRQRSTSRAPAARARCSSTSRRTCRRPSSTSSTPTRSTCRAGSRRTKVHERQVREAAKAIAEAQQPIVYAGGGVLNADACAELLALVEVGAACPQS